MVFAALAGCGGEASRSSGEAAEEAHTENAETTEEAASQLSVRDAVGQMFVVGMDGTEPNYYVEKMVWERNVGGVLLLGQYGVGGADEGTYGLAATPLFGDGSRHPAVRRG